MYRQITEVFLSFSGGRALDNYSYRQHCTEFSQVDKFKRGFAIDLHDLGNKYEGFPSNHTFLQFMFKQNSCNLGATLP